MRFYIHQSSHLWYIYIINLVKFQEIEKKYNIKFPSSLINFELKYGFTELHEYNMYPVTFVINKNKFNVHGYFQQFLNIDYLDWWHEMFSIDIAPPNFFPIASSSSHEIYIDLNQGEYHGRIMERLKTEEYYFDKYGNDNAPSDYGWEFGDIRNRTLGYIADSFEGLIAKITPFDEAIYEKDDEVFWG